MRKTPLKHGETVAARTRSEPLRLLSPFNDKSPKGEAHGFLTAMLYLAPAEVAGGKTVCPHSTEACRAGCLFTAGRGKTPRVESARIRRTQWYHRDREGFMRALDGDLELLQTIADHAGLRLAIRLNGTSDIGHRLGARDRRGQVAVRHPRQGAVLRLHPLAAAPPPRAG